MQHYSKKIFHSTQVFFFLEERKVSPNALSALPKRRLRKLKRRKKKFFRRFKFPERRFGVYAEGQGAFFVLKGFVFRLFGEV